MKINEKIIISIQNYLNQFFKPSHFLQAIPVVSIFLSMVLKFGYKGEFEHLQMNPGSFPGHLSWSFLSEQWPCPHDKHLQSSSQFILLTLGYSRLSRIFKTFLGAMLNLLGWIVANWTPVICVILRPLYTSERQVCSSLEHTPNAQCTDSCRQDSLSPGHGIQLPGAQHPRFSSTMMENISTWSATNNILSLQSNF